MTLPPPSRPQPPWQQPSYGPPAAPGPQMFPSPPVSGFAIASLVCSLVCLAPLGLVFGIIALIRTSRRGERGKGLAVAGVAVSGAVLVLAFLTLVGALRFSAWSSGSPDGPVRGTAGGASSPWRRAERLSCEEPHRGEIYGRFELTGRKAFPGTEEVMKASRDRCGPLLPDYAVDLTAHGPLQTYFSHPDRAGWERGGRTVLCWAGAPRGDLDEPIRKEESAFAPVQLAYVSAFRPLWEAQLRPPQRGPEEDLATASRWAGQMAAAYAEAARLLGDARGGLPGDVREPAGEIVVVFEAAVPRWERAARAADSDAYLAAIEQAGRDNGLAVGLDAEIRKGVGLPVPRSAAAGSGEGV